jgi:hypothetical protein
LSIAAGWKESDEGQVIQAAPGPPRRVAGPAECVRHSFRGAQDRPGPEEDHCGRHCLRPLGRLRTREAWAEPEGARGEGPNQPRDDRANRRGPSSGRRAPQATDRGAQYRTAKRPRTPHGLIRPASSVSSTSSDSRFAPALGRRGDRVDGGPPGGDRQSTRLRGGRSRSAARRAGLGCARRSRSHPQGTCGGPEASRGRGAKSGSAGAGARKGRRRCSRSCGREKGEEGGRDGKEQLGRQSAGRVARRIISFSPSSSSSPQRGRWIERSGARRPARDRVRWRPVRRMSPRTRGSPSGICGQASFSLGDAAPRNTACRGFSSP